MSAGGVDDPRKYTEFVVKNPRIGADGIYSENGQKVRIGEGSVRIGDLLLYNRHLGILTKDLPPVGYLSANDLMFHTFFKEPMEEPIGTAYPGNFSIVRLKR